MDLNGVADLLLSAHMMLSIAFQSARLVITQEESQQLAKAINNVARHYDIPSIGQETIDWILLFQALGMIYGSRIMASYYEAKANEAKNVTPEKITPNSQSPSKPQTPGRTTVDIPGVGSVEVPKH